MIARCRGKYILEPFLDNLVTGAFLTLIFTALSFNIALSIKILRVAVQKWSAHHTLHGP